MRRPLPNTGLRLEAVFGLVAMVVSSIVLLIEAPAFVGFGAAVLAAVIWCIWLDKHPEES